MLKTLREYSLDKTALIGIGGVANIAKRTVSTKPLSQALSNIPDNSKKLANGMVRSGQTNSGGTMLKMAMSGEEYDKEAFLGAMMQGAGKIFGGMGAKKLGTSMLNQGSRMKSGAKTGASAGAAAATKIQNTNRVKNLNPMGGPIRAGGKPTSLGLKGWAGKNLAGSESATVRGWGNKLLSSRHKSAIGQARVDNKYDIAKFRANNPESISAKNHIARKEGFVSEKKTVKRKMSPEEIAATKQKRVDKYQKNGPLDKEVRETARERFKKQHRQDRIDANKPEGTGTVSPSQTDEVAKLKKDLKKSKKKNKNKSLYKAYKSTKLHKNFGNTPLYAGGGIAAYSAGGDSGSPTVVNNG